MSIVSGAEKLFRSDSLRIRSQSDDLYCSAAALTGDFVPEDSAAAEPAAVAKHAGRLLSPCFALCLCAFTVSSTLRAQVESVAGPPPAAIWVSNGRLEGHLALTYSPAGAFSPDSSKLVVPSEGKLVLLNLAEARPEKILKPHLENISDLDIQSADFISPTRLFVLARGLVQVKGQKGLPPRTPQLAFQWYIDQDQLYDKLRMIGARGNFSPPRYFPEFGFLGFVKDSNFQFWSPNSGRAMSLTIPDLTHQPNLYAVSPDGHWMVLAQIETGGSADPVVVRLSEHKFIAALAGHQATVLCIQFSRDSQHVLTACEDGKVRVYSVGRWQLVHTLSGHEGPVHWAEFSPDGNRIASAGEDKTVRIWSASDGRLLQTLSESGSPLRTLAFSPSGEFLAASGESTVHVWKKMFGGR